MRRLKIYLDTSVISNLKAVDAPELMELSLLLWETLISGIYQVFLSPLVLAEIGRCPEPKRSILIKFLDQIEYDEVELNNEVDELAKQYIADGLIPIKYEDDAYHIAAATFIGCSAIISWNFSHMVKLKTILGVNGINRKFGYGEIEIITPASIVDKKED